MTATERKTMVSPELLATAAGLADLAAYVQGAVVSKTLIDKPVGTITLFAFDAGQGLSEHTAPYDACENTHRGKVACPGSWRRRDHAGWRAARGAGGRAIQDAACDDTGVVKGKSMVERLIAEMVKVFGDDVRRINHAMAVLWHAQRIRHAEGGDAMVVEAAAILHDIGIHEAERKHGSAAGEYQELEGPPIAAAILEKLGIGGERAEHVCCIVGNHHSARDIDSAEFNCIWDADWIVNIPEECSTMNGVKLASFIEGVLRTRAGKETARKLYLNN
jgi:hypothetical protein